MKFQITLVAALLYLTGCQSTEQSKKTETTPAPKTGITKATSPEKPIAIAEEESTKKQIAAVIEKPVPKPTKKLHTVTSLAVDFNRKDKTYIEATLADFKKAESRLSEKTPINVVTKSTFENLELDAAGANGIRMNSNSANGPFSTNKGAWKNMPIYDGYIFTKNNINSNRPPSLQLVELNDIPEGAEITLTIWGVGDTPDSDAVFELKYNGRLLDSLTTDYDGSEVDTRVQFTFTKIADANSLNLTWARHGATVTGLNGFTLVATEFK